MNLPKKSCNSELCPTYLGHTLGGVVSFQHATQIPASEVLPVKAINMHVFVILRYL